MKKIILVSITLALMFISNEIYSQFIHSFGFKGGLVSAYHSITATTTNEGAMSSPSRYGVTFGAFCEVLKVKNFSMSIESDFEEKGESFPGPNGSNYSTLYVLSIELLPKLSTTLGLFTPYFSLGPRIDFVFPGKNELFPGLYPDGNMINFGISILAGTEIELSKKIGLLAEISYSPDITSYRADLYDPDLANVHYRNISFEFRTGLKFDL